MSMTQKFEAFNQEHMKECLREVDHNYRPYDPGNYLYKLVVDVKDLSQKFSHDYIVLVYTTLSSWNMNSRGAKLADFEIFEKSLQSHKEDFFLLAEMKIGGINDFAVAQEVLKRLFFGLELVGKNDNGKEKPRLVTFSKTLHFLLPELVPPIDRTYTLNFFFGHTQIPGTVEKQFGKFMEIFTAFNEFAKSNNLTAFKDDKWNFNIPKIMDNLVIGHVRLKN